MNYIKHFFTIFIFSTIFIQAQIGTYDATQGTFEGPNGQKYTRDNGQVITVEEKFKRDIEKIEAETARTKQKKGPTVTKVLTQVGTKLIAEPLSTLTSVTIPFGGTSSQSSSDEKRGQDTVIQKNMPKQKSNSEDSKEKHSNEDEHKKLMESVSCPPQIKTTQQIIDTVMPKQSIENMVSESIKKQSTPLCKENTVLADFDRDMNDIKTSLEPKNKTDDKVTLPIIAKFKENERNHANIKAKKQIEEITKKHSTKDVDKRSELFEQKVATKNSSSLSLSANIEYAQDTVKGIAIGVETATRGIVRAADNLRKGELLACYDGVKEDFTQLLNETAVRDHNRDAKYEENKKRDRNAERDEYNRNRNRDRNAERDEYNKNRNRDRNAERDEYNKNRNRGR